MLQALHQINFFDDAAHLGQRASSLEFKRGIQPYLFKGLFAHRTEKTSASLLIMCYKMKENSAFIVDPSSARYALVILGLLPWLYTKRLESDTKVICGSLVDAMNSGTFKVRKFSSACRY